MSKNSRKFAKEYLSNYNSRRKRMTCKDFKEEFPGREILAFVIEEYTHIYKFNSEYITYFMRKFLDEHLKFWSMVYFYDVSKIDINYNEDVTYFKDKARFLYVVAKHLDQTGKVCVLKRVVEVPDLKHLEGRRARVITLFEKKK